MIVIKWGGKTHYRTNVRDRQTEEIERIIKLQKELYGECMYTIEEVEGKRP